MRGCCTKTKSHFASIALGREAPPHVNYTELHGHFVGPTSGRCPVSPIGYLSISLHANLQVYKKDVPAHVAGLHMTLTSMVWLHEWSLRPSALHIVISMSRLVHLTCDLQIG